MGNVFSGARAIFMLNGRKIAWASGVSGGEEIVYEPIEVLDNIEVQEWAPVGYRVSLACEIFRTIQGSPGGGGADAASMGSLRQQGIFPASADILIAGAMTAMIQDRLTTRTIFRVEEVKAASYNFSITSRGIVGQNVNFVCIRAKDESSIPAP